MRVKMHRIVNTYTGKVYEYPAETRSKKEFMDSVKFYSDYPEYLVYRGIVEEERR